MAKDGYIGVRLEPIRTALDEIARRRGVDWHDRGEAVRIIAEAVRFYAFELPIIMEDWHKVQESAKS